MNASQTVFFALFAGAVFTTVAPAQLRLVGPPERAPSPVNAPVAPEAIYVGSGGAAASIGVIDLNGFGQGTGVLARSNFVNNPNFGRPGLTPPLLPGVSNFDAGGEGLLTLTRDIRGNAQLIGRPELGSIADLQIGQPLDLVYNNENINVFVRVNQTNPATGSAQAGNTISVGPHPNPPKLILPPPNPARGIFGEEPTVTTSIDVPGRVTTASPPCVPSPINFLPNGRFSGVFNGPQPAPPTPPPPVPYCPFTSRQQVGHFLYALDRDNKQVVVLNSNRFTVLERFDLADPISMAMAPNLEILAVSNGRPGTVTFIDVDPRSINFHRVIAETRVGQGPRGLAWQPEGEDLFVCNEGDSTVAIVSGLDFSLRKTVRRLIHRPIDVAVTLRQVGVGYDTWTYFAYILNGDGTVAVFESGPTIIGADDIIAAPAQFSNAKAIQPDLMSFTSGCWVAHQDNVGLGQLSRLELTSSRRGARPYVRDLEGRGKVWSVTQRIGGLAGRDLLSGNVPVDIAFDDVDNRGAYPDVRSVWLPGLRYAPHSGKGQAKWDGASIVLAGAPRFVFIASADVGKVDVFDVATGIRVKTLDTPGVQALCHYWRQ